MPRPPALVTHQPFALAPGCSRTQSRHSTAHRGLYPPPLLGQPVQFPLENSPTPDSLITRAKQERRDLHGQVICFIVHYFSPFICQASVQEII